MIIILNGVCGVGKTTIASYISKKLESCVYLSGDLIHSFIVNNKIESQQLKITNDNIWLLSQNFKKNEFKYIIIDHVIESFDEFNKLKENLKKIDKEVLTFLLYCSVNTNITRDANRDEKDVCGKKRVLELNEVFDKNKHMHDFVIDTTHLTINQTGRIIIDFINDKESNSIEKLLLNESYKTMPSGIKGMHRISTSPNYPCFFEKAEGAYVWDADNNVYIDFVMGKGPLILGHKNRNIDDSIIEQLNQGIMYPVSSQLSLILAKKIIRLVKSADMVEFYNTGSCATSAAIELAKFVTHKKHIFSSGYHGWHSWCNGLSNNDYFHDFYYNLDVLNEKLTNNNDVAAVIISPECTYFSEQYYLNLQELCIQHNVIFILDEVKTGFRVSLGGFQELYNLSPDLSVFSKSMSNGYKIAALVGKKHFMSKLSDIHTSGTYDFQQLPFAAGIATIDFLENNDVIFKINQLGEWFINEMNNLFKKRQIAIRAIWSKGSFRFWFGNSLLEDKFYEAMACFGLLFYPYDNSFLSYAHTELILKDALEKVDDALGNKLNEFCGKEWHFNIDDISKIHHKKGFLCNYPGKDGVGK